MCEPQETLKDVEDAFQLLGLGFDATEDAVTKQYQRLALKNHPDKNPGREEAQAQFDKAKDLLDEYFKNRKSSLSRRATSNDPSDTNIPKGTKVQRGHSKEASTSNGHRNGRRRSSLDRIEVREDGLTYIEVEPATSSQEKKGKGDKSKKRILVRDKKTGKLVLGFK